MPRAWRRTGIYADPRSLCGVAREHKSADRLETVWLARLVRGITAHLNLLSDGSLTSTSQLLHLSKKRSVATPRENAFTHAQLESMWGLGGVGGPWLLNTH
jgi:hypothetical protein